MNKLITIAFFFSLSTVTACITDETDVVDETQIRQDPNAPETEEAPEGCRMLKNGDLIDCDIPEE